MRRSAGAFDFVMANPPFNVDDVDFFTALGLAGRVSKTMWAALDTHQVMIAADNPANHKQYDRMLLQTFILPAHSTPQEATDLVNAMRNMDASLEESARASGAAAKRYDIEAWFPGQEDGNIGADVAVGDFVVFGDDEERAFGKVGAELPRFVHAEIGEPHRGLAGVGHFPWLEQAGAVLACGAGEAELRESVARVRRVTEAPVIAVWTKADLIEPDAGRVARGGPPPDVTIARPTRSSITVPSRGQPIPRARCPPPRSR